MMQFANASAGNRGAATQWPLDLLNLLLTGRIGPMRRTTMVFRDLTVCRPGLQMPLLGPKSGLNRTMDFWLWQARGRR